MSAKQFGTHTGRRRPATSPGRPLSADGLDWVPDVVKPYLSTAERLAIRLKHTLTIEEYPR